jgi:processive 1,2-diacylglycerol beta-glucosyltransferase
VTATPLDICVVTGNNATARTRLAEMGAHPGHNCHVIGYTTQVDELMAAADVVVSKPGGLTTSESLARGCAMVVVEPIPGQEDRNSDFLLENGCAIKANNLATLTHKLDALLGDADRLGRMRSAAWRCGRPDAAKRVAEHCVHILAQRAITA